MAGKFYSQVTTLKWPWEEVAQALWKRYPNPYSKHVLTEDLLSRSAVGEKLTSKRLLTKTNKQPKWIEAVVGRISDAYVLEESFFDRKEKKIVTCTRNITHKKLLMVTERCTYYISPENKNWTCCLKEAWIKCHVFGISRAVERFGFERMKKNLNKAELGLVFVLEKLFNTASGVTLRDLPKQTSRTTT